MGKRKISGMVGSKYKMIVIGVSAGTINALKIIIPALLDNFPIAVAIVAHRSEDSDTFLADYLNDLSAVRVREITDKESIEGGTVYIAPGGYHALVDDERCFSLSVEGRVNYSRPSIDVLFDSAADVYGQSLIGLVLTGANSDGAAGLKKIKERGGFAIVQDPETAEATAMPRAAIEAVHVDKVVALDDIASLLNELGTGESVGDARDEG